MKSVLGKLTLVTILTVASSTVFAEDNRGSAAPRELVCNSLVAANVDSLNVSGKLVRQGAVHGRYWTVVSSTGKTWALVEIPKDLASDFELLENTQIKATVRCAGESMVDDVTVLDISPI